MKKSKSKPDFILSESEWKEIERRSRNAKKHPEKLKTWEQVKKEILSGNKNK